MTMSAEPFVRARTTYPASAPESDCCQCDRCREGVEMRQEADAEVARLREALKATLAILSDHRQSLDAVQADTAWRVTQLLAGKSGATP
jgi:hypothetical protein